MVLQPAIAKQCQSAIKTFCRLINRHPKEVIADPGVVRAHLARLSQRQSGLTKGSFANMKTGVSKAMALAGVKVHRRRRNSTLTLEWSSFLANANELDFRDLRPFAGWCGTFSISPSAVGQDTFERFLAYLQQHSIQKNPRERCHVARRAWNRMEVKRGGEERSIAGPNDGHWRSLQLDQLPQLLAAELALAFHTLAKPDPLDLAQKPLRPATIVNYEQSVRYYVSRLIECGIAPDQLASIDDLLIVHRIKSGIRAHGSDRSDEAAGPVRLRIAIALSALARYGNASPEVRQALKKIVKTLQHRRHGLTAKNKAAVAHLSARENLVRLLAVRDRVCGQLSSAKEPTFAQAKLMESAVLLELLLQHPLRIKNVADLDLGKTLIRPTPGSGAEWRISLMPKDVKNAKPIEMVLSEETGELFELYAAKFRPALLSGPSTALFPGQGSAARVPSSLAKQLKAFAWSQTGLIVHAHIFRHLAAKLFLQANPGEYETVRQLLGHKSVATTIDFYSDADTELAVRRYDEVVAEHRLRMPVVLQPKKRAVSVTGGEDYL